MTTSERLERLARQLRDSPVPDRHAAVIDLLAEVMADIAATSPADQAERVAIIARVMRD